MHWLGKGALTARAGVQSLVRKLKLHKPCSMAGKKKKTHANWENTERFLELQPRDQSTNLLYGQAQAISR